MSGGSYNYLCDALDLGELLDREHDLQAMAERLAGLGYAQDAARETEELLVLVRHWKTRAEVRHDRLRGLWKAVEWWDSNDRTEDAVKIALAAYRSDHGSTPPP